MIQLLNLRIKPQELLTRDHQRAFVQKIIQITVRDPWNFGLLRARARLSFAKSNEVTAVPCGSSLCTNVDIPGFTQGFRDVVTETCRA